MKEKDDSSIQTEENTSYGTVMMQSIPEFTSKFNKIVRKHKFKVANKKTNKVGDLTSKAKTPLGD